MQVLPGYTLRNPVSHGDLTISVDVEGQKLLFSYHNALGHDFL